MKLRARGSRIYFRIAPLAFAVFALAFSGCGGSAQPKNLFSPTIISVQISPQTVFVDAGQTTQFVALVGGTTTPGVTWSVQEGTSGGSVDSTGKYTAPSVFETYHIIATSVADPTKSAIAAVTVTGNRPIEPPVATLLPGATQKFQAYLTGAVLAGQVSYSVLEGSAGGTVDASGNYTAPKTPGTYHVVATNVATPTITATAVVNVQPGSGYFITHPALYPPLTGGSYILDALVLSLGDNSVLITGGQFGACFFGGGCAGLSIQAAEQIAVASDGSVTPVANLTTTQGRGSPVASRMQDGRYLIAGGYMNNGSWTNSAEIFDPQTKAFSAIAPMSGFTYSSSAITLTNGNVFVAGGGQSNTIYATFNPQTQSFTAPATIPNISSATFAPLPNGKVLIAQVAVPSGTGSGSVLTQSAYVIDPAQGTITSTGNMLVARVSASETVMPDGKILIAGGRDADGSFPRDIFSSAEIYDPASGKFTLTGTMTTPRVAHQAVLMANGKIFIWGGGSTVAELYDPATGQFSLAAASSATPHQGQHVHAVALPNGLVWLSTGFQDDIIELYHP